MFRTLVKIDALAIDDQTYSVRYFELRTLRGARRYSAELTLGPDDRIILEGIRQVREGDKVEYEFRHPEEVIANQKNEAE